MNELKSKSHNNVHQIHAEQCEVQNEVTLHENNVIEKVSKYIARTLEDIFYKYGCLIGKYPALFIVLCLSVTLVCSIGLINFTTEVRPFKLWVSQESDTVLVMDWQKENFPSIYRIHVVIYEAENILNKEVLLKMLRVHNVVQNTSTADKNWESMCATVPAAPGSSNRRKRSVDLNRFSDNILSRRKRQFGFFEDIRKRMYCNILDGLDQVCLEMNLLELWGYNESIIESLTDEQIIDDVNNKNTSEIYHIDRNFSELFGGIEKDSDGKIIKVSATKHIWFTRINETAVDQGDYISDTSLGDDIDVSGFEWENELINNLRIERSKSPADIKLSFMVAASFHNIGDETILRDVKFFILGFCVVLVFVQIILGKFNSVEQRPLLSFLGVNSIVMAMISSYGICSSFGIPYGPLNNVLPFLLLGIGVDDMFVIMQSWNNLSPDDQKLPLPERTGLAMKHAGVSITITSLTDFAAFAIGSATVLPALYSFCLYAAVGIIFLYFLQSTYFVALLTYDQRRIEKKYNSFIFCWQMKNWVPNKFSQRNLCQNFFTNYYSKFLLKKPVKFIILLITAIVIVASSWGLSNLRQEFNPEWFIPRDTYLSNFFTKNREYFSMYGKRGEILFGNVSLFEDLGNIKELVVKMKESKYVSQVDSWFEEYEKYMLSQNYEVPDPDSNEEDFQKNMQDFLFSISGSKYRFKNFKFNSTPECMEPLPLILASSIEFRHKILGESDVQILAMNEVKSIISEFNFTGYVKPMVRAYSGWETDQIIESELHWNMIFAIIIVFIMILTLIASLTTSVMVILCVVMTLIDTGALMHWWGLTIDTVSCIDLILAIGLCVDYSAHIGYTFMTANGTRDERARKTLGYIGPAVLYGGFSTFLSFVFLCNSSSHVFITFFKVFFGISLYGLYHGLVFLPVLLSLVGPKPYATATDLIILDENVLLQSIESPPVTPKTVPLIDIKPNDKYLSEPLLLENICKLRTTDI